MSFDELEVLQFYIDINNHYIIIFILILDFCFLV